MPTAAEGDARVRSTLDAMLEGCQILGFDWRYLYVNEAAAAHGRRPREGLIGRTMMEAYPGIENSEMFAALRRCMEQRVSERIENEFSFPDGTAGWFELSIEPVPEGVFILSIDRTDRHSAQEEAERLRRRSELLLNCAGEGIYGLDLGGCVTFINPEGANLLGYKVDELVGTLMHDITHHTYEDGRAFPREECPIYAAFTSGQVQAVDGDVMWQKDRTVIPVDYVVTPIRGEDGRLEGAVVVFHDISERRRLEEMVRRSQKLEATGRLAAGVAHDFNNILGVVTGFAELTRRKLDDEHPAQRRLEQIVRAAQRGAGLTRQLLAFSRQQVIEPQLLDLNAVLVDLEKMLQRVIRADVELELRPGADLGTVRADVTQLEQVILNLVVNARDAMPTGGRVTVETGNASFDDAYAKAHPPARAGDYVMLAVTDTGVGMDAETRARIFEPFFTTKAPGEGTGLGLATVYGIVKQSGGHIWVYSEPGRGTSFKIFFPCVDQEAEVAREAVAPETPARGDETVLVVEDTESMREVIREILEDQGYTVLLAPHGEEALALASAYDGPIHLLLTDLVMPKLGGADLAAKLVMLRPQMRVIYMSGYTDAALSREGARPPETTLLEKPFTGEQLLRAVRESLDELETHHPQP